jgi:hypothetical protein
MASEYGLAADKEFESREWPSSTRQFNTALSGVIRRFVRGIAPPRSARRQKDPVNEIASEA